MSHLPPLGQNVLAWNRAKAKVTRLVCTRNDRPDTRQVCFDGWYGYGDPTHWAAIAELNDSRWSREGFSAPYGTQILVRSDRRADGGFSAAVETKSDPRYVTDLDPFEWAIAWMSLNAAKRDAVDVPAEFLAQPSILDVRMRERKAEVARVAEDIFLSAVNDGELYRSTFYPLCTGKGLPFMRCIVYLSYYPTKRSHLVRSFVTSVLMRHALANSICPDYPLRSAAARAAADDVILYYMRHAAELNAVSE